MKKSILVYLILFFGFNLNNSFAQQNVSFKLPPYEKVVLPNGLTIFLMEQHEVPIISLSVILPAGAIYDGEQSGIASLTASSLLHGTKSYTKNQIEEELDFLGAGLDTYASKESAGIKAKFASKDQDKVLSIIKEILIHPIFDKEEFGKEKKRLVTSLEQQKERPQTVIGSYWDKFIYDNHVYGNPIYGSPTSVDKYSVKDVESFYKDNYSPKGSAIAIVGDFQSKVMKSKLTKLFQDWRSVTVTPFKNTAKLTPLFNTPRVLLVNKEDARETTFRIGGMGVNRSNPDYVAIQVVNTIFGGRFTSWLNDELRVSSGLTYGASSGFPTLKNSGTFYISTFTETSTTEAAIDKAIEVLQKIHRQGIDEETLISAKNYVKGQYPPRFETSEQLSSLLTEMFWYGFDESFINNFQKNVDGLTAEKAKDIVLKYFPKENLQFVLIGKADEIRKSVQKYGQVVEKQIKDDGF